MADIQEYIKERLTEGSRAQIKYFSGAATREQNKGKLYQNIQIWAAAATPLLIGATEILPEIETLLKLASLAAASATVVATGVLRVRQHWQQGVIYRGRQEALIRELQLWEHDAGRYATSALEKAKIDKDTLLVETCEGIIADDVSDWTNRMKDATSRVSADE